MRAIAAFHDHGVHPLNRFLKPGFRHCFVAVEADGWWVTLDGMAGRPVIDIIQPADFDLAAYYREKGFTVIETTQSRRIPVTPFLPANCVGLVKGILAIGAPWVMTPFQLYRHLSRDGMQLLPGKSVFSPPKPKIPKVEEPVTVEREDPAVVQAKEDVRKAELRRRGRRATILTSGAGAEENSQLGRAVASGGTPPPTSTLG